MKYAVLIGLAAISLTACSQNTSSPAGFVCPDILEVGPAIVMPSPGATGVPTAAGTLEFRDSLAPANVSVSLAPPTGSAIVLGTVQGGATPNPSTGYPLISLSYPTLASATTYTVTYTDQASHCPLGISNGGTFTTQ